MSAVSRKTVRDEISTALGNTVAGSGKPCSSVYGYQPGVLNGESPVVLVLSGSTQRQIAGVGSQKYRSRFDLELQILVYDGDKSNPLTEKQREDKVDEIEAALADWFAAHQSGTSYRACYYAEEKSTITTVNYLDGNPYRIEVIKVRVEASDT